MSGWLLLGVPGAIYATGLGESWIVIGLVIGAYLNWRFVAPRLRAYTEIANNSITVPSFFENRLRDHSHILRITAGAIILVFFTFYVSSGMVAGGANNQLLAETDGEELHRLGIVYGPDYILNSGGIINVETEITGEYNPDRAREKTERIYEITDRVITISKNGEIPTAKAADRLAEDRLKSVRGIRRLYRSNKIAPGSR